MLEDEYPNKLPPTYVAGFHNEESVRSTVYRQLGDTDLVVSKLSLGGASFGGLYGKCEDPTKIVHEALRNGVSFIDTAYWYGQGRSEQALGQALKDVPRGAYYIGTKVGRYELDYQRMFDYRGDRVLQSLDESIKRLRLNYVDIAQVQIHDCEFAPSESVILNETLPALQMAKMSGKVRYIGITGYPLNKMRSILEKSSVKIDVILTYCRASMNDSVLGQHIKFLQQKRIGIINAASTSMGLLTPQGPPTWHAASDLIKQACREAAAYCDSKGINVAKLANHYSLNFPGVHTTVIGVNSVDMMRENLVTSWTDLSDIEKRVRDRILRRYLEPLNNAHWEGVDVQKYWRALGQEGIPTLKHPPVVSIERQGSKGSLK